MAEVTLQEMLATTVVTRVISRIKTPLSRFQDFWGMGPGGPAENSVGGLSFQWDIFDKTRMIADGRPPGTGPANKPPQKIGVVTASAYRAHESIYLLDQHLYRTRQLGSGWDRIDSRGQAYVAKQQDYLAQRFRNNREFIVSRMMRGEFGIKIEGDNWTPVDIGGGEHITVDFQIPDTNKDGLNPGTGNILSQAWQTTTTDIPGEILKVNAQMEEDHGFPLRHLWMNTNTYNYLRVNDFTKSDAGTANVYFESMLRSGAVSAEGIGDTGFTVILRGLPNFIIHIYDGGLEVDGTYTKFIPDDYCVFTPDPGPMIAEWLQGSELVRETVVSEPMEAMGFTAWTTPSIDPSGFSLKAVDMGLPGLYIPKAIYYAKVANGPI